MESDPTDPSLPFADGCSLFDRLPTELVYAVICRIDDISSKMKLDLVSKRFYEANHKPQSWIFDKALAINYGHLPEGAIDDEEFDEIGHEPGLDEGGMDGVAGLFEFGAEPDEDDGPLEVGLDPIEELKWKLKLTFLPANEEYVISKSFSHMGFPMALFDAERGLRSLDAFLKRTQLNTLHLQGFKAFPDEKVWVFKELADTFVKNRPSLVQLNSLLLLEDSTEPVAWLLSALRGCNLPQLKKLGMCVDFENVDDLIWPFIDSCHHLTSLTVRSSHINNVHSCISALSQKSELSSLDINVFRGSGLFDVDSLLEIFKGCTKLSRLTFMDDYMNPIELSDRLPIASREKIRKFSGFNVIDNEEFSRRVAHYYPNIEKVSFFSRFHAETITRAILHFIDTCQGENSRTIHLYMPGIRDAEGLFRICVDLMFRGIAVSHSPRGCYSTISQCKKNNVTVKWEHHY